MDPRVVRELLEQVRDGRATVDDAVDALRALPFRDLGFANVDHHRALRQGAPEVVFGQGKSVDQIAAIAGEIARAGQNVLVTRVDAAKGAELAALLPGFQYAAAARVGHLRVGPAQRRDVRPVAVVSAGTSDQAVAEEAVETLAALGIEAQRMYDVGVAGIHRLFHRVEELRRASAVIVVAGMEGALASVVGGVVASPIVAVPCSVGYGAALFGFTALFAMLTSCAAGVVVVNIDNGFGAAMAVHRILAAAEAASGARESGAAGDEGA